MRIRTIKPDFWKHEALSALPEATQLLAIALLNYADDEGYFNANPLLVQAECSPLREPSVTVPVSLQRLQKIDYLRFGVARGGRKIGQIVNFKRHQVISHPKPSKFNGMEIVWEASGTVPVVVQEASIQEKEREREREKEREKERNLSKVIPSKPKDGFDVDFESFWNEVPRKVGKGQARTAFKTALKKTSLDTILTGIRRYAAEMRSNGGFPSPCHPKTWLTGERWLDEPEKSPNALIDEAQAKAAQEVFGDVDK